jgi:hypothetical protein
VCGVGDWEKNCYRKGGKLKKSRERDEADRQGEGPTNAFSEEIQVPVIEYGTVREINIKREKM